VLLSCCSCATYLINTSQTYLIDLQKVTLVAKTIDSAIAPLSSPIPDPQMMIIIGIPSHVEAGAAKLFDASEDLVNANKFIQAILDGNLCPDICGQNIQEALYLSWIS
jgi:hypothetical protein